MEKHLRFFLINEVCECEAHSVDKQVIADLALGRKDIDIVERYVPNNVNPVRWIMTTLHGEYGMFLDNFK